MLINAVATCMSIVKPVCMPDPCIFFLEASANRLRASLRPPLRQLRLVEIPQLVDAGRRARDGALRNLNGAANGSGIGNGILRRLGSDLDGADAWVVWAAVVLAVAQVSEPCLERGRVILVHKGAVGDDLRCAGNACPLATGREEGEVDDIV